MLTRKIPKNTVKFDFFVTCYGTCLAIKRDRFFDKIAIQNLPFVYLVNCDFQLKFVRVGTILVPLKGMGPQGFEPWIFAV